MAAVVNCCELELELVAWWLELCSTLAPAKMAEPEPSSEAKAAADLWLI